MLRLVLGLVALVLSFGLGLAKLVIGLALGLEDHVLGLGLVTLVLVNITGHNKWRLHESTMYNKRYLQSNSQT